MWHLVIVVVSGFTTLLTPQVISVAFYSEREKCQKFCSEALISAWGSFTFRKSTTGDPRLYFPSKGSHTQDFYALKTHRPRPGLNPRTSDSVASMITMGPPGSKILEFSLLLKIRNKNLRGSDKPYLVSIEIVLM